MKSIILATFLLFSQITSAQAGMRDLWGDSARRIVEIFDSPFTNPFLATVMGVCTISRFGYNKIEGRVRKRKIKLNGFKRKMPYMELLQVSNWEDYDRYNDFSERRVELTPKPAPVIIYVPGAFSGLKDPTNKLFSRVVFKRGFHIISLPNPWSETFIKRKAPYIPGSIEREAHSLYEMIQKVVKDLNDKKLIKNNEVHLVGVSYGAFLSAMLNRLDAQNNTNIFKKGKVTLFSPPFDFGRTMVRFDKMVEDIEDPFANYYLYMLFFKFIKVCRHNKVTDRVIEDSKGVSVYVGFKRNLILSLKKYLKAKRIGDWPLNSRHWEKEITFENYFQWYDPSVLEWLRNDTGKILHWLWYTKFHGRNNYRILVSEDDFLNDKGVWDNLRDENILIIPGGGHVGYSGLKWFKALLNAAFPLNKKR